MAKVPKSAAKTASKPKGKAKRRGRRSATSAVETFELGTDKLYFKIGEVAAIVDVAAHVLRYWESEFPLIKPQKSRSQQRVYGRKDVENLLRIKHLLYERKFTIAGARLELRGGVAKVERAPVSGLFKARQSLARVRVELSMLAASVRADHESIHLEADPARFVQAAGGAQGLLDAEGTGSPEQPILTRPKR